MLGTSVDDAAAMHLFRSISAREPPATTSSSSSSLAPPFEKRRSTSFDETHGELARACAGSCTDDYPLSSMSKKKPSFWQNTVSKFTKGKKAAKESLSSIPEKEDCAAPPWKRLLQKLRSKAKDARKPAICSSSRDVQVAYCERSSSMRGEGRSKSTGLQTEKQQRLYSVYPEPIPVRRRSTPVPIWERRSVACPPTLALNDLRVTGLRHVSRLHQPRG